MEKEEIFQHFKGIVDSLIDEYDFFKFYFQNPFSADDEISCSLKGVPFNLFMGMERGCLVDEDFPFVAKFPLNMDEFHGDKEACERELDSFDRAKYYGLEDCFCEPIYLGEYTRDIYFPDYFSFEDYFSDRAFSTDNIGSFDEDDAELIHIRFSLYAYPRGENFWDVSTRSSFSEEQQEYFSEEYAGPIFDRNIEIGSLFIEQYGVERIADLNHFLIEEKINDLHTGNVVFIDGQIKLSDYAGYNVGY